MLSSHRTKLSSPLVVLALVLAALTGLSAPAQAATARSISLTASPTVEYAGRAVVFSGSVSRSPKGSAVRIQRRSGTSWIAAGSTTTKTAAGGYAVRITLPGTPAAYRYRAVTPARGRLASATSRTITVTALRRTTATLSLSPASISTGASTTLSGTVTPYVAGTVVSLQRRSGSSWVQVATAALTATGGYARSVTPTGTTTYRAQVPRTGLNAGTVSPSRTVVVSNASGPTITTTSLPPADQSLPYSATLTKTGGAGTWTMVPGEPLKAGLSLAPDTGVISGTPTESGASSFYVRFTETSTGLSVIKQLSMFISPLPTITTATLPDATRGTPYSAPLASTGKPGTWSILNLPAGLTIDASTGTISGTTYAVTGDYGVYPVFTETSTGRSVLRPMALHVGGVPLAITTPAQLPDSHRGGAYTFTFTRSGLPGSWTAVELPAGFSLDTATGTLTGTPTVATVYLVRVSYTETGGATVTKDFALRVLQPEVTTASVPDGTTGTAYSQQFEKTGLDGTWSVSGFLPAGLDLSPSGSLSGTPTEAGDFGFYVSFTETSTGVSSTRGYLLHVSDPGSPTITTTSLPAGAIGTPYSATLAATPTGGTWSISYGSLPVGLSLDASTGAITGTPTHAENAQFIVTYTRGATKNTRYLTITVPASSS